MQDGREYGDNAAKNLLTPNSSLATSLGINMNEYYLFREVYLYVLKGKDQYTKADIVLVKYNALNQIDNVILLETKMGSTTAYTPRQKQSYRIIANGGGVGNFELRSPRFQTKLLNGTLVTDINGKQLDSPNILINQINTYKISDEGRKDGNLNKNLININSYSAYIAPDNK